MSFAFAGYAGAAWASGLLVVLVVIVFAMVRSRRPDPKMAFLLGLLANLPAEEGEQKPSRQAKVSDQPEPSSSVSTFGSHIYDFFACENARGQID